MNKIDRDNVKLFSMNTGELIIAEVDISEMLELLEISKDTNFLPLTNLDNVLIKRPFKVLMAYSEDQQAYVSTFVDWIPIGNMTKNFCLKENNIIAVIPPHENVIEQYINILQPKKERKPKKVAKETEEKSETGTSIIDFSKAIANKKNKNLILH